MKTELAEPKTENDTDAISTLAGMALSVRIQKMLKGTGQDVQGIALADLVSIYFAGHHPKLRRVVLPEWVRLMRSLIRPNEKLKGIKHGQ